MKAYITKYALSGGIQEKEVEPSSVSDKMVCGTGFDQYYIKPYWHLTREEAVAHAEQLRKAKIASLKKQIQKLEKAIF